MVNIMLSCPDCNKLANINVGQIARRDCLVWFRSWNCENCGFSLEEGGEDTPEDIRKIMMCEEGSWVLTISEMSKGVSAYKILKEVLALSLQDVAKLRKDQSGCVYTGTKAEVNFYQRQCVELGLELIANQKLD
jgi:hypothetical protein